MSKRPADIVSSTPASKVRRRLNFDSPGISRVAAPTVLVTNRRRAWTYRPMYRKPKMYRMFKSPDVPRGCEGPCKVQARLLFVTRTVGAAARLIPGLSKFSRRRTLETGVEITISAGRFDITTCTYDKNQITHEIVSHRIRVVCICYKLTVFYS